MFEDFCDCLDFLEENIENFPPLMFPAINMGLSTLVDYIQANKEE